MRNGDPVLVGSTYGRIRAMFDDRGKPLEKAGPSVPVEILGLNDVPNAGDKLYVATDLRKAQEVAEQPRPSTGAGPWRSPRAPSTCSGSSPRSRAPSR